MLPKSLFTSLSCLPFPILTFHCSSEPDRIPLSFQTQLKATSSPKPSLTPQTQDTLFSFLISQTARGLACSFSAV